VNISSNLIAIPHKAMMPKTTPIYKRRKKWGWGPAIVRRIRLG